MSIDWASKLTGLGDDFAAWSALISGGETARLEFKTRLLSDVWLARCPAAKKQRNQDTMAKVWGTLQGMADAGGGAVLIGVGENNKLKKLADDLRQMCGNAHVACTQGMLATDVTQRPCHRTASEILDFPGVPIGDQHYLNGLKDELDDLGVTLDEWDQQVLKFLDSLDHDSVRFKELIAAPKCNARSKGGGFETRTRMYTRSAFIPRFSATEVHLGHADFGRRGRLAWLAVAARPGVRVYRDGSKDLRFQARHGRHVPIEVTGEALIGLHEKHSVDRPSVVNPPDLAAWTQVAESLQGTERLHRTGGHWHATSSGAPRVPVEGNELALVLNADRPQDDLLQRLSAAGFADWASQPGELLGRTEGAIAQLSRTPVFWFYNVDEATPEPRLSAVHRVRRYAHNDYQRQFEALLGEPGPLARHPGVLKRIGDRTIDQPGWPLGWALTTPGTVLVCGPEVDRQVLARRLAGRLVDAGHVVALETPERWLAGHPFLAQARPRFVTVGRGPDISLLTEDDGGPGQVWTLNERFEALPDVSALRAEIDRRLPPNRNQPWLRTDPGRLLGLWRSAWLYWTGLDQQWPADPPDAADADAQERESHPDPNGFDPKPNSFRSYPSATLLAALAYPHDLGMLRRWVDDLAGVPIRPQSASAPDGKVAGWHLAMAVWAAWTMDPSTEEANAAWLDELARSRPVAALALWLSSSRYLACGAGRVVDDGDLEGAQARQVAIQMLGRPGPLGPCEAALADQTGHIALQVRADVRDGANRLASAPLAQRLAALCEVGAVESALALLPSRPDHARHHEQLLQLAHRLLLAAPELTGRLATRAWARAAIAALPWSQEDLTGLTPFELQMVLQLAPSYAGPALRKALIALRSHEDRHVREDACHKDLVSP